MVPIAGVDTLSSAVIVFHEVHTKPTNAMDLVFHLHPAIAMDLYNLGLKSLTHSFYSCIHPPL
jgi:hypothetical protein